MNKGQKLINCMINGDMAAIKSGLKSNATDLKIIAIIHSILYHIDSDDVVEQIKILKEDNNYMDLCAFTVGEFAVAGLHLLGIECYYGDNPSIQRLIESKFNFK